VKLSILSSRLAETHRAGISQDIRQAYSFICNNSTIEEDSAKRGAEDEIVLIGFS
jgi:hypothetical protein